MPLLNLRAENYPHVRLFQGLNLLYCRLYHRLDILSPSTLPRTGPGILAANHTSHLDPFLIQAVTGRRIIWMMTRDFYELPVLNRFFRSIDAISVNRDGKDVAALRLAFRALQNGDVLGIFPEGRIAETRQLLPFQTGVALIAGRTKVPIYPVYLDGDQRNTSLAGAFAAHHHASIRFGPPLAPEGSLDDLTAKLRQAIEALGLAGRARHSFSGFASPEQPVQSDPVKS